MTAPIMRRFAFNALSLSPSLKSLAAARPQIQVRLPDNTTTDGFLGLYDKDIAIVTPIGYLDDDPVDLDLQESPDCPDGHAALGGSLVGNDKRFHGMIVDLCHHGSENKKCAKFLSLKALRERLELFKILNPRELHFRHYSLPEGVSSVVPSGFMKTIYRIKSLGYPMPPPLVLEYILCKEMEVSPEKAGIGDPLIGFDGSFVGMNFYDGSDVTPFLPRLVVFNLLRGVVNSRLPSESGEYPMRILDDFMVGEKYRWPVPEPYWSHGELDVDMDELPKFIGRILN
nr:unnamed protein product [Digitaria exilis]